MAAHSCFTRSIPILLETGNRYCSRTIVMCTNRFIKNSDSENRSLERPMVTENDINSDCQNAPLDILDEPTTCCMSGCPNCVWIEYAEKLSQRLKDSDDNIQKVIMEKVQDPNMRAFLSMELKCRNLGSNFNSTL